MKRVSSAESLHQRFVGEIEQSPKIHAWHIKILDFSFFPHSMIYPTNRAVDVTRNVIFPAETLSSSLFPVSHPELVNMANWFYFGHVFRFYNIQIWCLLCWCKCCIILLCIWSYESVALFFFAWFLFPFAGFLDRNIFHYANEPRAVSQKMHVWAKNISANIDTSCKDLKIHIMWKRPKQFMPKLELSFTIYQKCGLVCT